MVLEESESIPTHLECSDLGELEYANSQVGR